MKKTFVSCLILMMVAFALHAQSEGDPSHLTIDRIYASNEFKSDYQPPINWIDGGNAYVIVEMNDQHIPQLVKYETATGKQSILLSADELTPRGGSRPIVISNFV